MLTAKNEISPRQYIDGPLVAITGFRIFLFALMLIGDDDD